MKKAGRLFSILVVAALLFTGPVSGAQKTKDKPVKLHNGDVITFWWYVFEFTYLDTFLRTLNTVDW